MKKDYFDIIEEARETVEINSGLTTLEALISDTNTDDVVLVGEDTPHEGITMDDVDALQLEMELANALPAQPMCMKVPIEDKYKDTFDGFTMPGVSEEWIAPAKVDVVHTPTYGKVEAWYIHDADTAYQMSGIAEVYMEAREYWPQADRAGLYALVMLVIARTTNDNPEWATHTVS